MKRKISPAEAKRMLARVNEQVSFWLCTNAYLRNIDELARALESVTDDVFRYHVNRDKNDFEAWIRDVVKDKELAREISRIKTRETLVRKIFERVEELRAVVGNASSLRKKQGKQKRQKKPGRTGKTKKVGKARKAGSAGKLSKAGRKPKARKASGKAKAAGRGTRKRRKKNRR